MDLKRLRYYCAIYEAGSISRAAETLHMSQPPLGQRLRELEDELGVTLIVRDGKHWQVTEAGRILYERARQLLVQSESLVDEVRRVERGVEGTVLIGTSTTCFLHVQRALSALLTGNPNLHFKLMVAESTALELQIKQRALDLAVVLLPLADNAYDVDLLPVGDFSAVFGKGIPAASGVGPISVRDLADLPLICHRRWDGHGVTEYLITQFQQEKIHPNIVLESPDARSMFSFIAAGLSAVALVPTMEIPELFHNNFHIRPLDIPRLLIQPAVVRLKGRYLTGAVRRVLEELVKI